MIVLLLLLLVWGIVDSGVRRTSGYVLLVAILMHVLHRTDVVAMVYYYDSRGW